MAKAKFLNDQSKVRKGLEYTVRSQDIGGKIILSPEPVSWRTESILPSSTTNLFDVEVPWFHPMWLRNLGMATVCGAARGNTVDVPLVHQADLCASHSDAKGRKGTARTSSWCRNA